MGLDKGGQVERSLPFSDPVPMGPHAHLFPSPQESGASLFYRNGTEETLDSGTADRAEGRYTDIWITAVLEGRLSNSQ